MQETTELIKAQTSELMRLRNRHVAKLLCFLGDDQPRYIARAIKQSYNWMIDDVQANILDPAGAEKLLKKHCAKQAGM